MTFGHEPARRDLPGGEAATAPPSAAAPDPPALAVSGVRPAAAEPHFLDQLGRDLAQEPRGAGTGLHAVQPPAFRVRGVELTTKLRRAQAAKWADRRLERRVMPR